MNVAQQWSHKTFFVPDRNLDPGSDGRTSALDHQLTQLGELGWQMVTMVGHARSGTDVGYLVVMKRESDSARQVRVAV